MMDTPDFSGKVVLVAGASSGINLSIAQAFAKAGAQVVVLSRSAERISRAAELVGRNALGLMADVRNFDEIEQAFAVTHQRYGGVHVVVSGAAGNFLAAAAEMSANAFRTVVDIDLLGTFNVFRASYPYLFKPGASLIGISAGQAVEPVMLQAHACAAKAGVNMLIRCLAMEWGRSGVRVNGISPGPIAGTEGMRRLTPNAAAESAIKDSIPLGDYGEMEDIANLALFLCSPSAKYITGAIINCDGGPRMTGFDNGLTSSIKAEVNC